MTATAPHAHVPARTVLAALGVTLAAAAVELAGARGGRSLFLVADAAHLLAHVGIFVVLLLPAGRAHDRGEDVTTTLVLVIVAAIAAGILAHSTRSLLASAEPPSPGLMLLAVFGLAANLVTAWLFSDAARTRWSFRAALAHELSDGALSVAGLAGALAIRLFGLRWVDPTLSFAIGAWLAFWSARLLVRRARGGRVVWLLER